MLRIQNKHIPLGSELYARSLLDQFVTERPIKGRLLYVGVKIKSIRTVKFI